MKPLKAAGQLVLALLLSFPLSLFAQAPEISIHTGIPVTNTSGRGVAYGGGVYITITEKYLYKSTDGETWNKVKDAGIPDQQLYNVVFGNGLFVVAGESGLLITSPDGEHWTSRTSNTSNRLVWASFLNGQFFVSGISGTLVRSTNGITWTTITVNGSLNRDLINVVYGNGLYAVAANTDGGGVFYSATGNSNSWTKATTPYITTINKFVYLKDRFFIFYSNHQVSSSANGTTFTEQTNSMTQTMPEGNTVGWVAGNQIFSGLYDGTRFIFYGSGQYYAGYGTVWTSNDGINLKQELKTAYMVPHHAAFLNGKYFQSGNEGVVVSDDGINYRHPAGNYAGMATDGSSYVAVGYIGNLGNIFTSSDFSTWQSRTPSLQKNLTAIVYNPDAAKYVAVGEKTVTQSTDGGNTWTTIASPNYNFYSVAYTGSRYAAAGSSASGPAAPLVSSPDGITWTTANTLPNYYLKVKAINNHFFAMGYSDITYTGVIMHSTDGISWNDITPSLPFQVYYFNDVVFDGTKYHFMGVETNDPATFDVDEFFSISTATLTDPNSYSNKGTITAPPEANIGGNFGEGVFAWKDGRFVGSAYDVYSLNSYILTSTDGVNWNATVSEEPFFMSGIAATGSRFLLSGYNGSTATVDFSNSTLPVHFSGFTARLEGTKVVLDWQTAMEENSDRFIVQHSTNGQDWSAIGTVRAAGFSGEGHSYSFTHDKPAQGTNFYRITEVDHDGKRQATKNNKVFIGKTMQLSVFPNPAGSATTVRLPSASPSRVLLFNAAGLRVAESYQQQQAVTISFEGFPAGIYQLVVVQDGQKMTRTVSHH